MQHVARLAHADAVNYVPLTREIQICSDAAINNYNDGMTSSRNDWVRAILQRGDVATARRWLLCSWLAPAGSTSGAEHGLYNGTWARNARKQGLAAASHAANAFQSIADARADEYEPMSRCAKRAWKVWFGCARASGRDNRRSRNGQGTTRKIAKRDRT